MRVESLLKNKINISIIEDDKSFREIFSMLLKKHGEVKSYGSPEEFFRDPTHTDCQILFVDLEINQKLQGPETVKKAADLNIYPVVISGHEDDDLVAECYNLGAKDYYTKGDNLSFIKDIFDHYIESISISNKTQRSLNPLFNQSLNFLFDNAGTDYPILLSGETGSGKSYYAKLIHEQSAVSGNFVALNCSSIAKDLFESEMFGHKKGAFSGATEDYRGKIADAHTGTLYLDEIDSMPLEQQAKLLKVLEDKSFYSVGSNKLVHSDFRLICSSQKNMQDLIAEGKFREDLYYRISFIHTKLLPLRERAEDIQNLLKTFLKGSKRFHFTDEAKSMIAQYPWPGNLRELNIFASRIKLLKKSVIESDFVESFTAKDIEVNTNTSELPMHLKELLDNEGLDALLNTVKAQAIEHTLKKHNGKVTHALKELKISSASFYRWRDHEKL